MDGAVVGANGDPRAVADEVADALDVVDAIGVVGTAVGAIGGPTGTVGTVAGENVIVSTAGPTATHDVFTVYEPATFDVNATLNVVSLTFVTGPTTTSDVGLPLASNTRTSN